MSRAVVDGITQALLGAVVGHAIAGRKLGARATRWGAVGGVIPDLDSFVAAPFGEFATMVHHRGITHSLWFGPVVGSALGWLLWKWYRRRDPEKNGGAEQRTAWMLAMAFAVGTHPWLDSMTSYGTQLLTPFSNQRFAFEGIGIIDPLYSLVLVAALVVARVRRGRPEFTKVVSWSALGLTTAYVILGMVLNARAVNFAREDLTKRGVSFDALYAYPTVFQLWLRRVAVHSPERLLVGYVSTWKPSPVHWWAGKIERSERIETVRKTERGQLFEWFAVGRTVGHERASPEGYVVEIDDVRYGLPGTPGFGMWGIRATLDAQGAIVNPPTRFRRELGRDTSTAIADTWRAAFGYDPRTYLVGVCKDAPCPILEVTAD